MDFIKLRAMAKGWGGRAFASARPYTQSSAPGKQKQKQKKT